MNVSSGKRYFWLKLKEDFFQSKRIKKLRNMAGGDTYLIIYLKLQLKAMKSDGIITFDHLEQDIATELALDLDEQPDDVAATMLYLLHCGLAESSDNEAFFFPYAIENVGSENSSAQRVREYRERQKALHCNTNETQVKRICNGEIEKEIEKEIDITDSKESVCRTGDVRRITEAWNSLGLGQISKLTGSSKRGGMLRARVNEYGADAVLQAIEKIRNSSFLRGQNRRGWTITFDWFVRPNNFPKVLEGQYDDHEGTAIDQSSLTPSSDHEFWGWG